MIEHVMERVQTLSNQFCRESQTEQNQSTYDPRRNEGFSLHSERFSEGGKKVLKTDENSIMTTGGRSDASGQVKREILEFQRVFKAMFPKVNRPVHHKIQQERRVMDFIFPLDSSFQAKQPEHRAIFCPYGSLFKYKVAPLHLTPKQLTLGDPEYQNRSQHQCLYHEN
jgi:hypothetical protein